MVDDDDVAFHRPPPHLSDETVLELAAFLTNASVGSRVQLVPEQARFRQFRQLSPVARAGGLFPGRNRAVLFDFPQAAEHGLIGQVIQLLPA